MHGSSHRFRRLSRLICLLACWLPGHAGAAFVMTGGQSFTWMFLLKQQGGDYTTLDFGLDSLGIGEELHVDFYENASDSQPFRSQTILGRSTRLVAFTWIGLENEGHFQDREGAITLTLNTGSLAMDFLYLSTKIGGRNYTASISSLPVPEPRWPVGILIIGAWLARRRCRLPLEAVSV